MVFVDFFFLVFVLFLVFAFDLVLDFFFFALAFASSSASYLDLNAVWTAAPIAHASSSWMWSR